MAEEKKSYEEVFGVNLDISTVLSGEIVKRFMAQITPEQMQNILDDISKDAFKKKYDGTLEIRMGKDNNGYGFSRKTLGSFVKERFNEQVKEDLMEECLKIVETKDYKDKIHAWAEEIVDYCTEGYKDDLKKGLYHKLVGGVVDMDAMNMQQINGNDLHYIIQQEISRFLSNARG